MSDPTDPSTVPVTNCQRLARLIADLIKFADDLTAIMSFVATEAAHPDLFADTTKAGFERGRLQAIARSMSGVRLFINTHQATAELHSDGCDLTDEELGRCFAELLRNMTSKVALDHNYSWDRWRTNTDISFMSSAVSGQLGATAGYTEAAQMVSRIVAEHIPESLGADTSSNEDFEATTKAEFISEMARYRTESTQ